jgi:hypothetical protein
MQLSLHPVIVEPTDKELLKEIAQEKVEENDDKQEFLVVPRKYFQRECIHTPGVDIENEVNTVGGHQEHTDQIKWIGPHWLPEWLADAEADASDDVLQA